MFAYLCVCACMRNFIQALKSTDLSFYSLVVTLRRCVSGAFCCLVECDFNPEDDMKSLHDTYNAATRISDNKRGKYISSEFNSQKLLLLCYQYHYYSCLLCLHNTKTLYSVTGAFDEEERQKNNKHLGKFKIHIQVLQLT